MRRPTRRAALVSPTSVPLPRPCVIPEAAHSLLSSPVWRLARVCEAGTLTAFAHLGHRDSPPAASSGTRNVAPQDGHERRMGIRHRKNLDVRPAKCRPLTRILPSCWYNGRKKHWQIRRGRGKISGNPVLARVSRGGVVARPAPRAGRRTAVWRPNTNPAFTLTAPGNFAAPFAAATKRLSLGQAMPTARPRRTGGLAAAWGWAGGCHGSRRVARGQHAGCSSVAGGGTAPRQGERRSLQAFPRLGMLDCRMTALVQFSWHCRAR
jgi:hypothetical protein